MLSQRKTLYAAKIEEPDLPIPQVDTIVSEPIGVLLFHERMASINQIMFAKQEKKRNWFD